jgi:hypothetical protein
MKTYVLIPLAVVAGLLGPAAHASATQDRIVAELQEQGFSRIEVSRTLLGRTRIVAEGEGVEREIILNPASGVILRDFLKRLDDGDADDDVGTAVGTAGGSEGVSGGGGGGGTSGSSGSGRDGSDDRDGDDNSGSGSSGSGGDSDDDSGDDGDSGDDSDNSGSGSGDSGSDDDSDDSDDSDDDDN